MYGVIIKAALLFFKSRSKDFRTAYGRLHELRAIVPERTPYLACTATATKSIREEVMKSLDMYDCDFVFTSPDRPNIFYEVRPRTEIELDMKPFVCSLKNHLVRAPRIIVYCQSLNLCADLYAHFMDELGDDAYYPVHSEKIIANRLIGMFHSRTTDNNKDLLLKGLTNSDGKVRIVFATSALGMGVHMTDVNTIVHYGAPSSIDDYFQSSGRGGRSGSEARSVVFWIPRDCPFRKNPKTTRDYELVSVRKYLENTTTCRRSWLLKYFDQFLSSDVTPKHCCDICAKQ